MSEYVYSLNDETYHDLENLLDDIDLMCEDSGRPINANMEIYKAEKVVRTHSSFININSILKEISQNAYDEAGEYAEVYCNKLDYMSNDKTKELKQLLNDFFDEHIGQPDFYTVRNVIKIQYKDINENT